MAKNDETRSKILSHIIHSYSDGIGAIELNREYQKWSGDKTIGLNMGRFLENKPVKTQTHSGIVLYYPKEEIHIPGHIRELGPTSPVREIFLTSLLDAHSFVAAIIGTNRADLKQYLERLNADCEGAEREEKLHKITPTIVWPGDCYVTKCDGHWIRVRVDSRSRFSEDAAACFLLDFGLFKEFACVDLRIPPEEYVEKDGEFLTPKRFKTPGMVVRCYLDMKSVFPRSATGLRYALCEKKKLNSMSIKVRFLGYNSDKDSYRVELLSADESEDLFSEALRRIPRLLELDKHFERKIEDQVNSTEEFIADIDTFFGEMTN